MNTTPIPPEEKATLKRLIQTGRDLIRYCNRTTPSIAQIASASIHSNVIEKIKKRPDFKPEDLYVLVYDECRSRKDRHRQPTSPSDDPNSDHSKATYLAVYGFADMVMESLDGFNPLMQDGSEESLPDYYRDIICLQTCLVNLHRMQIHADKAVPVEEKEKEKKKLLTTH